MTATHYLDGLRRGKWKGAKELAERILVNGYATGDPRYIAFEVAELKKIIAVKLKEAAER